MHSLRGADSEKEQISRENELLGACLLCKLEKKKKTRRDQKAPAHTRVKLHCQDIPPGSLRHGFGSILFQEIGFHLDIFKKKEREKRKP